MNVWAALLLFLSLLAGACAAKADAQQDAADTIDPSLMTLTFSEEFNDLDVGRRNQPGRKWTAGLPYRGDFGRAQFVGSPRREFPFRIDDGVLIIEAHRRWNGKWESGLLSSVDGSYNGFSQKYGYFETRMKMPGGPGTWPAFWLLGTGQGLDGYTAEIDIIEFYPRREKNYDTALRVFYGKGLGQNKKKVKKFILPNTAFTETFNTYGALVTPEDVSFYLNRKEVSRFPTFPEHRQPFYILLNLALEKQTDLDTLESPQRLYVDYVRVYALDSNNQ